MRLHLCYNICTTIQVSLGPVSEEISPFLSVEEQLRMLNVLYSSSRLSTSSLILSMQRLRGRPRGRVVRGVHCSQQFFRHSSSSCVNIPT